MARDAAFLIPNSSLVRDPVTREPLPVAGKMVTLLGSEGRYWRRRIRDESVIIGKLPVVQKTTEKKSRLRGEG